MTKGLLIGAISSNSGKTLITLGLIGALKNKGLKIAPFKVGPDYIDGQFLALSAMEPTFNLDSFAFEKNHLEGLAYQGAKNADLMVVEGVMGLFDGAAKNGKGSSADVAQKLNLPIILVVDCSKMAQSIAPLIFGFKNYDKGVNIAGVILNKVGSPRHEKMLRDALKGQNIKIFGVFYQNEDLKIPSRHLGLTLPNEIKNAQNLIKNAAEIISKSVDLEAIINLAKPIKKTEFISNIAPLGQHIAIAKDSAFAFIYEHILLDWKKQGAKISFFSPLNNEVPDVKADAVFLPGGYPELYAKQISNADNFFKGLKDARNRDALIYGECGGFMVLGEAIIDKYGESHKMSGLLPITSTINSPKRILGYRYLTHNSSLPFTENLIAHEFHYSMVSGNNLPALFKARDSMGNELPAMGAQRGKVMGSYAHVICVGQERK